VRKTEVDSHATFDLDTHYGGASPLILSQRTEELIGARYLGERQVIHPLDSHFATVLAKLETLFNGDLGAISSDESGERWVVIFTHDREPGLTYFYDHSTGESRLLCRPYPHLDSHALAPKTPVTITARDGLSLPSYLTLPVDLEPSGLAMVLLVHGGPWARDCWGYEPDVQLLANRGYAVLQVNFRGSTGYGKALVKAAIGEFAGKMHDDLIDAVGNQGGLRGSRPRRHLRGVVRRLRHAGRRHLHPGCLRRSHRLCRHFEPGELHADTACDRAAPPGQQLAPVRR
jgi:hypothetical protein